MRNAAIVLLMLFVTVPVFGDQATRDPKLTARFGALRPAQGAGPYRNLFRAQEVLKNAVAEQPAATPKVVCGMLVIPADPRLDPKMAITPKKQDRVEPRIRAIEPPICNPAK